METDDRKPAGDAPGSESTGGEPAKPASNEGVEAATGTDPGIIPESPVSDPAMTGPIMTAPITTNPVMAQRKFAQVSRRELLKVAPVLALGAFAIPGAQEWLLKKGLGFSDWASGRMFRSRHLATTFSDSELTPFNKFPLNYYDVDDPGVIFENWTLTVSGSVQKPGDYKLAQIQALPRQRQNTRHICVEGWDVIGRFGGTRLSNFMNMIGADTSARYITVACADDYYETLDMETALHPQTLLCWEMYDQPLTREHGAPLRLQVPTKIGYKQAKYLTDLKVTNVIDKVGYWEDQGYDYFYGL
ncbi:MAG: molybdopterin-dependent oxidoreductase [Candidatus Sulfotelmatobacter sp.]